MTSLPLQSRRQETSVGVAQCAVLRGSGMLHSHGLGSCVAVVLYDRETRTAGLAHILLPNDTYSRDRSRPAKFANTAVPHLIAEMHRAGAGQRLTARLVGGAAMFGALLSNSGINMGARNIAAVRSALGRAGIVITGEDVGGDVGRTVYMDVADGSVTVICINRGTREL
ncbi:MAG: chemotaxis protein CheD [Gemmatimonadaceae bacterium]